MIFRTNLELNDLQVPIEKSYILLVILMLQLTDPENSMMDI